MSKHTPRPWQAISLTPEIVGPNGCSIAIAMPSHLSADVSDNDQQKANAALIAAAPDLLEVCQMMVEAMFHAPHPEFMNRCAKAADAARAALAKAQGKE